MSELSRCGRIYNGFDAAWKAAELRSIKGSAALQIDSCNLHPDAPDAFHVRKAKGKASTRVKRYRPDPFPPVVAALIDKRDEGLCQRCGRGGRLERHHRRLKSMGGSKARAHTQCACNGLSLCRRCHSEVHERPGAAVRPGGYIVMQSVARPGSMQVLRHLGVGAFDEQVFDPQWATCDGRWVHSPAETED